MNIVAPQIFEDMLASNVPTPSSGTIAVFSEGGKLKQKDSSAVVSDFTLGGGGGIIYNEVTTTTQTAAVDNGYIANNAAQVVITLPGTAALGKSVAVGGKGAGGWRISQPAGVTIRFLDASTTSGTGGYLASTNRYDVIELLCITPNTEWLVIRSVGNITIV